MFFLYLAWLAVVPIHPEKIHPVVCIHSSCPLLLFTTTIHQVCLSILSMGIWVAFRVCLL